MHVLILIHLIISFIYFFCWFNINKQESIFRFAIALFLPLVGYILFLSLWLMDKLTINKDSSQLLFINESDNKPLDEKINYFDINKELNLIPMEEALLINNYHTIRKMILGIISDDMGRYPQVLKNALSNKDSETSHYAATAIVELRRKKHCCIKRGRIIIKQMEVIKMCCSAMLMH